ncbi:MAG: pyridoxal phosphate-dependent aminotransferase [Oscillospiraceae bacterium]|nr:pyridoxal phosphate-dependent aminotransferase [Oscillospiraceae bacterium]
MNFDFSTPVDRHGTGSLKYDFAAQRGKPADVLPLWVADMDFQTVPQVSEALEKAARFGVFGYTESTDSYFQAVADWFAKRHGWRPEKEWLVKTPGVVFALAAAVRAFTQPGEAVLLQQPVYYPFSEIIRDNGRQLVNNPLVLKDGHYEIDFQDFETKIRENHVKLFLLCSPHNPVGRVWKREELQRMGEICLKYHVIVAADEIHADFVWPGHTHTPFLAVDPRFLDSTVLCTAPSKTFNLAGLQTSNIFVANQQLRKKLEKQIAAAGYSQLNQMGLIACETAYRYGEPWLEALLQYLQGNIRFVREFLQKNLSQIQLIEPEGTYLLWLDCRGFGLTQEQLEDLVVNRAKLWLDSGSVFGKTGEGFERINIACQRETLQKALQQLQKAVAESPLIS